MHNLLAGIGQAPIGPAIFVLLMGGLIYAFMIAWTRSVSKHSKDQLANQIQCALDWIKYDEEYASYERKVAAGETDACPPAKPDWAWS